jgi:large subunit ribosomal protein L35
VRTHALVARIKAHPAYTEAMGADLALIGPEWSPPAARTDLSDLPDLLPWNGRLTARAGRAYNLGFPSESKGPAAGTIMPKQKTHKGTKKRFRLTAKGKVKHRHAGTSHHAFRRSKKRRRQLRGTTVMAAASTPKVVKALAGNSY